MTTIHETKKAIKLEKDGVYFWIQKRWLKADGSLTPAGEKAFEQTKEAETFKNSLQPLPAEPAWESEKAVGIDMYFFMGRCDGEKDIIRRERIFLPKSQIKEGKVMGWLLGKKIAEANDKAVMEREHYSVIDYNFSGQF